MPHPDSLASPLTGRHYPAGLALGAIAAGTATAFAVVVTQAQTGPYAACVFTAVLCCAIALAFATKGAAALQQLSSQSSGARFLVGISLGLVGLIGLAGLSVVIRSGASQWRLYALVASALLVVIASIVKPEAILTALDHLDQPRDHRRLHRLTFAGWLAVGITATAMFGLGIPVVMWLYQALDPRVGPTTSLPYRSL